MSTYEEEIFNYLTKKENFISAHEIYEKFPGIKEKLIKEFWYEVKNSLDEKRKGTDWKVDFDHDEPEIKLYFDKSIYVGFEGLYDKKPNYYLYVYYEKNKKLDRVKINKYASNIKVIDEENWEKEKEGTHYWKYLEDDFSNINTLKRILPENRKDFAEELAKLLLEFGKGLKEDILKMSKMIKK